MPDNFERIASIYTNLEDILQILAKRYVIPEKALEFIRLLIIVSSKNGCLEFDITDEELIDFAKKSLSTIKRNRRELKDYLQQPSAKAFVIIKQSLHTKEGFTTYSLIGLAKVIDFAVRKVGTVELIHNIEVRHKFVSALDEEFNRLPYAIVEERSQSHGRSRNAQEIAAQIRQELSGREHTDSVDLLREDRAR